LIVTHCFSPDDAGKNDLPTSEQREVQGRFKIFFQDLKILPKICKFLARAGNYQSV